ncbi:hypothetical protein [Flavobacterium sp. KACC 22763]|uniref:hypothetical protein n=1 Tax=Flavobacterium sp. KACC 22763 TaxID=3025668 RepID=UPI00236642FB|nr:hypothetical protein [Flavobacterium sp. KACC 22763]WDF65950.1 hypothetical protein PQ463_07205 [Flavobacterium sp. KACC 22763]
MNSYNENLHSSVLSSLESQEMTKKQLSSQLSNSMFTLYYAEGAEIVAQEKLDATTKMYKEQQHINNVVVKNKNMADNLLLSANQQKTYVTQAVTNMAVCASNIQIASNSIVRLASDIGSIYSIINAADYGTQIYQQALEAYNLINKTAYIAEQNSQYAMEATASISEVSTSVVADGAKLTNTSVNNLLQVTTSDLTATTAVLTIDNDTKAKASIATRAAEGAIKCSEVEYDASKKAYNYNNALFNQSLAVEVPKQFDPTAGTFSVSFDVYKSPFLPEDRDSGTPNKGLANPVLSYNIIMVKDSRKSFFSASTAELLVGSSSQCKSIPASQNPDAKGKYKTTIAYKELRDSDNDPLVLGENYVAFLLIIFTENYKKEINTFDEYLSAPSETFALTYTLKNAKNITNSGNSSEDLSGIIFTVDKEEVLKSNEIDYRCFFLPYPDDIATNEDLKSLEYDIDTQELDEEIKVVDAEIKFLEEEIVTLNNSAGQTEGAKKDKETDQDKQKNLSLKSALADTKEKLRIAKSQLTDLNAKLKNIKDNSPKPVKNSKAFFFNLNLAENIPAGNFTSASHHKAASGQEFSVHIGSTTTDNFGNPLVEEKSYIPVVLSFYNGSENSKAKYTNSLSDWQNTTPISYSTKKNSKSSTL